ncbi:hypothetical protein K402DRAFT_152062 [Aulographum hederae CBS 113979]|uniref:Uncharacterized protein n=1 Tax=Aulographum hederae CBS 113979 TaxID=1176131 RepID=A0A6G1GT35_9PEZI|nr:hypothetical protein K402DRAFT_152062 [Aulographum hederae CBS 113979]
MENPRANISRDDEPSFYLEGCHCFICGFFLWDPRLDFFDFLGEEDVGEQGEQEQDLVIGLEEGVKNSGLVGLHSIDDPAAKVSADEDPGELEPHLAPRLDWNILRFKNVKWMKKLRIIAKSPHSPNAKSCYVTGLAELEVNGRRTVRARRGSHPNAPTGDEVGWLTLDLYQEYYPDWSLQVLRFTKTVLLCCKRYSKHRGPLLLSLI